MTSDELSQDLRETRDDLMGRRRKIVCLELASIGLMGLIALYQTGVIKHLPEPPVQMLDGDKINGSPQAYEVLGTPDAVLALGSYAATLGLAAMGSSRRAAENPVIPLGLAAKATFDAALAAKLALDQPTKYKAFSLFSVMSSLATFTVFTLVWPEARAGWRSLAAKGRPSA